MKHTIALILALLLLVTPTVADEEDTLEQVEKHAEKIKELIDKYNEAKVDFVKTEEVTIKDEQGNPHDCDVAIFYSNGKQPRLTTKGGTFTGDFNHGQTVPKKPFSIRLSGCACRPIEIKHTATWLQINEQLEKIKEVIEDEIRGKAEEKAKELGEKAVKKVFEKLGYGAAASGFLSGFGAGVALGQPIGDYITEQINKILDLAREQNIKAAEYFDYAPLRPNIGRLSPRGWTIFGENPSMKNTWDITVRCGQRTIPAADASWVRPEQLAPRTPPEPQEEPEEYGETEEERRDRLERERQEREEQRRREREERERQERERREREEARRRYEERQRQLRQKAQEIMKTCPLCDDIRKQMEQVSEQIKNKEQEVAENEKNVGDKEAEHDKAKGKLERAQRKLHEFRNPQSYVESQGRRVTTTDIEVQRQMSIENWQRYQRGEQSAEETMENWEKQGTPEEHEKAKKAAEERLEQDVQQAEQELKQAEQNLQQAKQQLNKSKQELSNLKNLLEELKKKLEDCLKLCKKYAMDIARGRVVDYEGLKYLEGRDQVSEPETTEGPYCKRYKQLIANEGFTVEDYERMSRQDLKERGVSITLQSVIAEAKRDCDKEKGLLVQTGQKVVRTPQQDIVVEDIGVEPASCEDICKARDMTTQRKDWSSRILNTLNEQGVCKTSAHVQFPQQLRVGNCNCYSAQPPKVTIAPDTLICKGTACGDVPCGSSRQCSCGENCITTVSCKWGGWKQDGHAFRATAGAVET